MRVGFDMKRVSFAEKRMHLTAKTDFVVKRISPRSVFRREAYFVVGRIFSSQAVDDFRGEMK